MKDIRFKLNLYFIIPVIFAGLTALSFLVAYQLMRVYIENDMPPGWPLAFWGTLLVLFTFICGLLTVKFIIDPIRKFVVQTEHMGVLRDHEPSPDSPASESDINQFARVFDRVTELLGKVEARELFPEVIGQSKPMRSVFRQVLKVAPTDSTVLIIGETGTGKELVANSIHHHSRRKAKPFMAINCAAIPESLLESELFGHEKGAFTGATARKPGKFELAHGSTLFLDEIGDMPLEIQAKVLRAIEEKRIERIGGLSSRSVDVRFLAATNKDLPDLVKKGLFRQDLFYRLNGFSIYLPPLRERREDIALLAEHFLRNTDEKKRLSSATIQILMAHEWPGNVRELKNTINSAVLMSESNIEPTHLPSSIASHWLHAPSAAPLSAPRDSLQNMNLDETLRDLEKGIIEQALNQCRGVQKQAARLLGIKERSLWHRLRKYDIKASEFKE